MPSTPRVFVVVYALAMHNSKPVQVRSCDETDQ